MSDEKCNIVSHFRGLEVGIKYMKEKKEKEKKMNNKKCNILIPYACRSDKALTQPLIDAFEKEEWCNVITISLVPAHYENNVDFTIMKLNALKEEFKIHLAIICGDRVEMAACAAACFHSKVPIAHYGAGIVGDFATFDAVNRHVISLYADIHLCENQREYKNVVSLLKAIGYNKRFRVATVGSLYWEGLDDVDESLVPDTPYDLVLINPTTLKEDDSVEMEGYNELVIYIESNQDTILSEVSIFKVPIQEVWHFKNLERPKFLGLLKNCERYITNSSSAYYEAPYYLDDEQIILVGERNSIRSTTFERQEFKTSERIVDIIKGWWERNDG